VNLGESQPSREIDSEDGLEVRDQSDLSSNESSFLD
jgi:hypothetical protein